MKNKLSMSISLGLLGVLVSCATRITPVKITSGNPNDELTLQSKMIEAGYTNQVDVLAADDFKEARKYFSKANKQNSKGASNKEILTSLSYSRAYLEHANLEAETVSRHLEEITKARQDSILVGARNFPELLKALDAELDEMSSSDSGKVSHAEKIALQNKYIDLELICIKSNKLGGAQKLLNEAQEKNAEEITPIAYAEAITKFHIANKLIETDRHSDIPIHTAVLAAEVSIQRVLGLLISEKKSRNQTPEQRAVTLESRDNDINMAKAHTFKVKSDSLEKDEVMLEQSKVIAAQRITEAEEKMVNDAAAQFTKAEAEVYRQDGVLVIRLKSMNFASGRSDLPSESIAVLSKVKGIILQLGSGDVAVQGHTDSRGQAISNQVLSEKRAESVMKYFASGEELETKTLSSAGFGYTKPLATNKTKAGRSQNRRVDVLITTNKTY